MGLDEPEDDLTAEELRGLDDELVMAPGVSEQRWAMVNAKFCELLRGGKIAPVADI